MSDVTKAREAVMERLGPVIDYGSVNLGPRLSHLHNALDALVLAARRDERERLASAVELPATDPRSPTALCGWAKEPPGLAAWLRKEAP